MSESTIIKRIFLNMVVIAAYVALSLPAIHAVAQTTAAKSAAVLDFDLLNDMKEYDSAEVKAAQENRLKMISDELRRQFTQRGLYRVVDNGKANELINRLKATYDLRDCHGCEIGIGKALQADRIVIAWVQKVST